MERRWIIITLQIIIQDTFVSLGTILILELLAVDAEEFLLHLKSWYITPFKL